VSNEVEVALETTAAQRLRLVATLVRTTRDLDLAQDVVADAYEAAVRQWPQDGVPANPTGWLTAVARRRAIDAVRRRETLQRKLPLLLVEETDEPESYPDDRLELIVTCCHPALAREAQVPLALRVLGGLDVDDIAAVLLLKPATVAARVTRAKAKLGASGVRYRVPDPQELPDRLQGVLDVVAAIHTVGHTAPTGPERPDIADLAWQLCGALLELCPQDHEVAGLAAVVLLARARAAGSRGPDGELLLLRDADRGRWATAPLRDGLHLASRALAGPLGPYALQAGIAGLHTSAASWEETDWPRVVQFYELLADRSPGPVVELNLVVARSMLPGTGGADLATLDRRLAALADDPALRGYPYLPAARADLAERRGDASAAQAHLTRALTLAGNDGQRDALRRRRDTLLGSDTDDRPTV